jgi:transposase
VTGRTGHALLSAQFSIRHCRACPCRSLCTHSKREGRRLRLPTQARYEALWAARQREQTEDFKTTYARRAGIEGTLSYATGALGMRRTRYIGLAKTHLQHVATAAAMNLARLFAWLQGKPRAKTRISPFAALAVF